MSNIKDILTNITENNLVDAKKLITQSLVQKLGNVLESKIEEVAPSMISEKSEASTAEKSKLKKKRGVTDFNKKSDDTGDKNELKDSVEYDTTSDDEEFEQFVDRVQEIIEEIEAETGEELTEQEIVALGEQYLKYLAEEKSN